MRYCATSSRVITVAISMFSPRLEYLIASYIKVFVSLAIVIFNTEGKFKNPLVHHSAIYICLDTFRDANW